MNNQSTLTPARVEEDRRVLELLSQSFPDVRAAASEIINLEAIMNLPKGTEHFVADLHGESDAFGHIIRNASGNIRRKVTELFGTELSTADIRQLCSLIYYPEQKLELITAELPSDESLDDFYTLTLHRLVRTLRSVGSKYTRSKVRKALPPSFAYIIEEMLQESTSDDNKQAYFRQIVKTIITTGQAKACIASMCHVIQKLSIDRLHILGDVYDRGPGAHHIMDMLMSYGDFDIQWGNHDALWMGAAAGNDACIANVLRVSLRYGNLATLEDGYGINLLPLATFAMETYADDPCEEFMPRLDADSPLSEKTRRLIARMHKAISIIQFKLEAALIDRYPAWGLAARKLLGAIDFSAGTVQLDGKTYPLLDSHLPTVSPVTPNALTPEESELVAKLHHSFRVSDKLDRHIRCLLKHGSMYGVYNANLLFHASLPLEADGSLRRVDVGGEKVSGRRLMEAVAGVMRDAFDADAPIERRTYAVDFYWYLWCGPDSPLFDKPLMTTFERYFIADKDTHKEGKGHYYELRNDPAVCAMIMDEFGVTGAHRHIINGHVPVRLGKGETPIRADGSLMVIDGGFSKAYHQTTGSAGYTLVYHSRGFQLVKHEPFTSTAEAIRNGTDIVSTTEIVELSSHRMRVRDTDKGTELQGQIDELTELLYAYRHGLIKQSSHRRK
ncbi:MAG: fructose-1,6-bisphosphatase [Bacteroides sp.]|nr:fructose-1,6-bisphosphatase [Bacteroides sp.]MCM1095738.1 fructose-1,6-bisphosphatase [Terasakiella sp.]